MAQYGLETETTTHLKGMKFGDTQTGAGRYTWHDLSIIDKYYLSEDGCLLCISPLVPAEITGIAYYKINEVYYYSSAFFRSKERNNNGILTFQTGGYGKPSNLSFVVVCKSLEDYREWEHEWNFRNKDNKNRTFEEYPATPPFGVWFANIGFY